jgi:hypothetical protein
VPAGERLEHVDLDGAEWKMHVAIRGHGGGQRAGEVLQLLPGRSQPVAIEVQGHRSVVEDQAQVLGPTAAAGWDEPVAQLGRPLGRSAHEGVAGPGLVVPHDVGDDRIEHAAPVLRARSSRLRNCLTHEPGGESGPRRPVRESIRAVTVGRPEGMMGFSVKIAPGVRVRASSRGIRTSIGPRAARLHVGGGRAGFSTGVGPLGYYTSLGGGRRRPASRPSAGAYQRQLAVSPAAAAKAEESQRLATLFQALLNIHRESFEPAQPPVAPLPPEPDAEAIHARHREAALSGIGIFQRRERAAARERAAQAAEAEVHALREQARRQQTEYQAELDAWWAALLSNDPGTVLGTLAEAFEDNEAAAAPVGVDGDEVSIVVLAPDDSIVPERLPGRTPSGNLSLRKLPKGERAALYTQAVMGHVLVTIKEALAVAPGIEHVRVMALRRAGLDAYGRPRLECVLAGRWARRALQGVAWRTAAAVTVTQDTADELVMKLRGGKELQPLDLDRHPDIRELLGMVDMKELTGDVRAARGIARGRSHAASGVDREHAGAVLGGEPDLEEAVAAPQPLHGGGGDVVPPGEHLRDHVGRLQVPAAHVAGRPDLQVTAARAVEAQRGGAGLALPRRGQGAVLGPQDGGERAVERRAVGGAGQDGGTVRAHGVSSGTVELDLVLGGGLRRGDRSERQRGGQPGGGKNNTLVHRMSPVVSRWVSSTWGGPLEPDLGRDWRRLGSG